MISAGDDLVYRSELLKDCVQLYSHPEAFLQCEYTILERNMREKAFTLHPKQQWRHYQRFRLQSGLHSPGWDTCWRRWRTAPCCSRTSASAPTGGRGRGGRQRRGGRSAHRASSWRLSSTTAPQRKHLRHKGQNVSFEYVKRRREVPRLIRINIIISS